MSTMNYPQVRRTEDVDDFHGQQVADPYSWLSDPDSEETKQFVAEQNKLSESYIATELRDQFKER